MLVVLNEFGAWSDDRERPFGELLGYTPWQMAYWLSHLRIAPQLRTLSPLVAQSCPYRRSPDWSAFYKNWRAVAFRKANFRVDYLS
jgi:hypothetical protein